MKWLYTTQTFEVRVLFTFLYDCRNYSSQIHWRSCMWPWIPSETFCQCFNLFLCTLFVMKTYDYGQDCHFNNKMESILITNFVTVLSRPKFSVVIVKKRISARLFHKADDGSLGNPPPGTVVDTDITRKKWYEFCFNFIWGGMLHFWAGSILNSLFLLERERSWRLRICIGTWCKQDYK